MHKLLALAALAFLFSLNASANVCVGPDGNWVLYNSSPFADYLPDHNTTYWRYVFDGSRLGDTVLAIRGEFPAADYLNFTVYDQEEVKTDPAQSLTDDHIRPEPGLDANGKKHYVIYMALNEAALRRYLGAKYDSANKLLLPASRRHFYDLFYRLYAPHDLTTIAGRNGAVPLPTIETAQADRGCPALKNSGIPLSDSTTDLPKELVNAQIPFYRYDPDRTGIYGRHHDNLYLLARLNFDFGALAYFSLKPPPASQARYYSVCLAGASGRGSYCTFDRFVVRDAQGIAHFVIGPESVKAQVQALGFNFIPRGQLVVPLIMYRILEPTAAFRKTIEEIPTAAASPRVEVRSEWLPVGRHFASVAELAKAIPAPHPGAVFHDIVRAEWPVEIAPLDRAHLRIGMSWDYIVPRTVAQLTEPHPRSQREREVFFRTQMGTLTSMMQMSFDRLFPLPGAQVKHSCEVRPPDVLAKQLEQGSLDLGILPGSVFTRLSPYFPNLVPLLSLNAPRSRVPEKKSIFVVLPQNSVLSSLQELKGRRLLFYETMDTDAFLYLSQLLYAHGERSLDDWFALEKKAGATEALDAIATADAYGDFDVVEGKEPPPFTLVTANTLEYYNWLHAISEKNYHLAVIDWKKVDNADAADFDGQILTPLDGDATLEKLESENPLPLPASLVVYDKSKLDAAQAEEIARNFVPDLREPNPLGVFGLASARKVTPQLSQTLQGFDRALGARKEYFLPFIKFQAKKR